MHLSRRQFTKNCTVMTVMANSGFHAFALEEEPGAPLAEDVDRIHPIIGASTSRELGEGKTFPGSATPFGLVQLSPDTITGGDNGPGYSYEQTTIEGFSHLHLSGVGWYGDFGNLQVMPTTGPMQLACGRVEHPDEGWRSVFRHDTELATADYYAVTLDRYKIRAEMTAAPRSGMLRFTYPAAKEARIQIDLARRIGGTSTRQYVRVVDEYAIEGWMRCPPKGGGWGNGAGHADYTIYFRTIFSRPLENFGVWSIQMPQSFPPKSGLVTDFFQTDEYYRMVAAGEVLRSCREKEGDHIGFFLEFPAAAGEQVMMKSGVSFVSMDGARANVSRDLPDWDFAAAHQRGRALWSEACSKVELAGGTEDQRAIFETALYHAMIDPRVATDADGRFVDGAGKIRQGAGYTRRTIFSGWDVFRGEMPLMTLLRPDVVCDTINSLVDLAEESGRGYLERWEIANAYSGCMNGDPATAVILDAYSKGIRGFDVERAYATCRKTAAGVGAETNRPDNEFYMEHGYVPGLVSWTLDNAYFDWCTAKLAQGLGKVDDARRFFERARNYRKIYDPQVNCMRARERDGSWLPWQGREAFGQGCTESNPGQQTWFVPHDVHGLMELMGEEAFVRSLEELFERTPPSFGWNPFYNHSNEPVHHVAYLFVYAGKPWLTQKWVRRILAGAYKNSVDGICGNDDVGQMSAWYVLSAMGFYPVCPGDGMYILGSPLFASVTIRVDAERSNSKSFRIVAHGNSERNIFIRRAWLNGKRLERAWILHEEIVAGGLLELEMSSEPNPKWGASGSQRPPQRRYHS